MRHYYAEFCPRGINTMSEFDLLCKFNSKQERDAFIEYVNEASNSYDGSDFAEAVTLKSRAHRYPVRSIRAEWEDHTGCDFPHWSIGQRNGYVM